MFEGIKRFAGGLFGGGGPNSGFPATDARGFDFDDPMAFNQGLGDSTGNRGGAAFNFNNPFRNAGNAFSGENALKGFKALLDIQGKQGDRRTQGSYGQGYGFQGYGGSRGGQGGGFVGGTPGYSSSIYLPAENSGYIGGGGQAGGGGKPSRMAKALGGAAALAPLGPVGAGIGAVAGFLS